MEEKDITLSVAEKMLSYVDSTDREIWYKMAAALKNHFGEDGRGLYHKWSAKAENYNERAADSQFDSARYGSNNIWFLYNRAKERGWQPDKTYQPTAAEIEQQRQKLAQAEKKRQKEERERAKKQANASRRAKYVFEERTKQADTQHPYLVKKGISDPAVLQHIRQSGNNLIIPLKQGKKVVGMEMIFPNGGKHFPANTPKKGSALFLGDTRLENLKQGFFVAEGFATAASIVQATGRPCLMTIDAGNMPTVAKTLKPLIDKYQMPVWVAADINDGSVKNPNVGLQHAQEVVEILGETVRIITPDFTDNEVQQWKITHDNEPPTDFNDLQAIGGIERVRSVLATAFSEPEPVVNIQNPEQKLLINVYGSPATGKSYTAEHLAALLKDAGIECELVTEYATELIHQGRTDELKDQVFVTGEQLRREQAALNHANIVITDSPTALGIIYAPEHQKAALHDIAAQSDKIPHINILLRHDYESLATFSMNGRIHDKEQSLAIQEQLIEMLKGKERIHHQRATPFEELINHIGTNQEWQRFAKHHNINLPRFDIAMDGTVMNKDDNLSGSLNVAENDTLVVEKTAESITMNDLKPIQARSYDNDPIRKAIQDFVIDDIKANFTLYQQEYRQHPESFDGRYICSDLFKETIPFYNTDRESRYLFNGLVHNSAAVLAEKQFYDALSEIRQENDSKGKVAVFLTGSPGAGKTSSVQQGMVDEPNTALIYEGQLIRPDSAIDKIQAALDSGLKVKILAVQNTPETALDNTIKRFEKLGRGSSIEVMAQIMGKTADGLDKLHQHFGDRIELEIHERYENDPLPPQYGWEHLGILRKYGDYEKIRQYLGQVLEQSRETGTYSENALHQANGRVGRVEQKHKLSLTSALLAYETRPRVLGDSRKQSLLSALETLTPSQTQPERTNDDEMPRPERAEWEKDFPKAVTNDLKGNLIDLPNYKDAKSGDLVAALDLVQNALTNDTVAQIKRNFAIDKDTLIVPVSALEQAGNNPIPNALARMLADRLGLEVHTDIVQATRVARTRKSADYRLIFQPAFTGEVLPNRNYLIVDDTLIQGGTVASLRGYINNRGGKVIGVAVLSAKEHSLQLAPTPEILHNINHKFGEELNEYWQKEFNYGINQLTNSEAVVLSKGNDLVSIRNRIAQEILSASGQVFPTGNTAAEIIPKELVAVIREIKDNNPNNVLRLETPKDVSNGRVFYETENFVIQQVADNSRYFQAWHKQDLNVPLQVGDKAKIYVDRNGQTQAKITDTSQERFRQAENTHGNGVGRTQTGYVESGGMVGQTTITGKSKDLQSTQVIQDKPLNPTDEIPRPPQGGFVLPVENQSDENRQPENSNSKENSMDEQQQGLQASSFTPDKFQPDTWQPESGLEQNKHLDGETAQKVDETTTQAVDNTEKDLSGSPEQSAKPQIDKDFAERQAELNRQKAEWQNKLDEMYRQKEAMDNLQVQLTQEQLDEIDKKFEEIYAKQAELDRQTDELQIERRQVLGQADISENLNEENSIYFGESDEIITAEEINKPQAVFTTPQDKANAVFEELKTHYQGYGEYNSNTGVMYLPNGKNAEMLHFDPTQERIVLSAVNPQTKGREEIADTHFSNLDPHYIALAVDKDYQQYQQTIAQNQGKFPDNEQKKTIDKAGDSVEETIRTAKSKTAKLTPPNAPPETISERYNAVERKFLDTKTNLRLTHRVDYVDSENGKTVLFTDKGSKLTTAKNDPQTAADMVEVAKAKGWTTLKLSGNKEFKRQVWLAAESQGIKTKGYKPSPQDLAMLEKMREKRSLNSVEQTKKQEKAPDRQPEHTPQAEKQVEKTPQKDLSGSHKQESTPETAIQGGILLEHGAARFQFDKDKPMNYYAMLQMPNGEKQVLWGKEIEKTLQEHNVQIGDRISLQKNGYVNVRVQEPIKDKDGKTVLDENGNPKTEEVMRQRNHWDLTIFDKAQEVPKEQEVKHDLMGQPLDEIRQEQESNRRELAQAAKLRTRAISNADKFSSLSAGQSEDGLVPADVKTSTDRLQAVGNRVLANTASKKGVSKTVTQAKNAKKPSTQIGKSGSPNAAIGTKTRLTQAQQLFKSKVDKLSLTERNKILAYEKGASEIWDRIADENTKNRLQVNFYTNAARSIENGEKLPPAMSNAAAKEALENRRTEREQEMTMGR